MSINIDKSIHRDYLKDQLRHFEKYVLWNLEDRDGTDVLIPKYYKLTDWKPLTKYWIGECVIHDDSVYEVVEDVDDQQADFPADSMKLIGGKNHFVYTNELEIDSTTPSWNILAPSRVGQIYLLKTPEDKPVKIGDESFKSKDFIMVMNDVDLDPTTGDPTADVKVNKFSNFTETFIVVNQLPTPEEGIVETAIYEWKTNEQKDIRYFKLSDEEVAAGSYIDEMGIHMKGAMLRDYDFGSVAVDVDAVVTEIGATEVTEDEGNVNCFVWYTKKGENFAQDFATFTKEPVIELYVYDTVTAKWNKFYPIDGLTNPVTVEYIDQHTYDVITGKEEDPTITMEYSEYSFYVITDAEQPTILLHGKNLYTEQAVQEVEVLPTADIRKNLFYKLITKNAYDLKYYKMSQAQKDLGAVIDTAGIIVYNGTELVTFTYAEIAADSTFNTTYGFTALAEGEAVDGDCYVAYKDAENNAQAAKAVGFEVTEEFELYIYANEEWQLLYPIEQGGIIDVDILPIEDIKPQCLYRLATQEEIEKQTNIEFYDITIDPTRVVMSDTGISIDGDAEVEFDTIAANKDDYITILGLTPVADQASCGPLALVFYIEDEANKCENANTFVPTTELVTKYELYFYSEATVEWYKIYPTATEFETEEINFNDDTEWYPEKQV